MINNPSDDIVREITDRWRDEIDSLSTDDGFNNIVRESNFFQMDSYKPDVVYIVYFRFLYSEDRTDSYHKWHELLEKHFLDKFVNPDGEYELKKNGGNDYIINNEFVHHMTNQKYRFIVEFYPLKCIQEIKRKERIEKLNDLGIN